MSIPVVNEPDTGASLRQLCSALQTAQFPLSGPHAEAGREACADLIHQLEDYILPRYASLDAPLLAVVGGPTGSGKSLLVNSLIREHVASSSAIRPTTRRPLLVHAPQEGKWFGSQRVLPGLARVSGEDRSEGQGSETGDSNDAISASAHGELRLASSAGIPESLALLDSPDIDSVVEENRRLAAQLLAAADLWIFVTTAARYSDAIPWALLDEAARRNIVMAVILNRVPAGVGAQIRPDLSRRLAEHGLGAAPLFVVSEALDEDGFIPAANIEALRLWLAGIAEDSASRASVARQTLGGAMDALLARESDILGAMDEQLAMRSRMEDELARAFEAAETAVKNSIDDGTMLRGEVLARWQEIVGTGEWMRKLESGVASLRDKVGGWFRGRSSTVTATGVGEAVEDSLLTMLVARAEDALATIEDEWLSRPEAVSVLTAAHMSLRSPEEREAAAARTVQEWQRGLVEMVSSTGRDKKSTARVLSVGVNVVGAALMIVIFASTAGLTGGEVAVAGGTAVVAQRVLEAVFGDDAVRRMTSQAKADLLDRTRRFLADDTRPFQECLDVLEIDETTREEIARSFATARTARGKEQSQ
ncbi:dynamin family protein [Actinomycetaceae bacterium L2_0104]